MNGRLLILGGTGKLGLAVVEAAAEEVEFLALGRDWLDLQSTTAEHVHELIDDLGPAVVINAAAMAWVDVCETERDAALAVNATGPGHLAAACAALDVPLIHISTDYVFGDRPGPHPEDAPTGPVQWYGETKRRGEQAVAAAGGRGCVARVSWLFGPTAPGFDDFVLDKAEEGAQSVGVFAWQQSRPTFLPSLARWLVALAMHLGSGGEAPSILHPGGGPGASRAEWARAVLDANGFGEVDVVDQGDDDQDGAVVARRPADSRLDATATARWAASVGLPAMPDWRNALR